MSFAASRRVEQNFLRRRGCTHHSALFGNDRRTPAAALMNGKHLSGLSQSQNLVAPFVREFRAELSGEIDIPLPLHQSNLPA